MTLATLIDALESVAPLALAEPWDNVGLLVGDPMDALGGPVLLTIDLTPGVVDEAIALRAGAVVAYHPPIFDPIRRLGGPAPRERALLRLVRAGAAIYSPHTALDAAPGGTADWLLDASAPGEIVERRALAAHAPARNSFKVIVFVPSAPPEVVERVRAAMANAGAGRIGAYEQCSFASPGRGSFLGGPGTNPVVGIRGGGRLEFVDEHRVEMVCPAGALGGVLRALRGTHPYEEPAFDVVPLAPAPDGRVGAGRLGVLRAGSTLGAVARRVGASLGVLVSSSGDDDRPVRSIAVCPGSGASLLDAAAGAGAEVFVTGEVKHHDALRAADLGLSLVLAGHTETERGYLPTLAARLGGLLAGVRFEVSRADRPQLRAVT
ncbi:MAG TPA: Nif3-like dinuclear metal center hexameric protein [Phycisphaerales bacterium]|nr:Nif3-like dinuclear metal center hexameric protein [Phycisphaerales bacterium]